MTRRSGPPLHVAQLTLPDRIGGYAKGDRTRRVILQAAHDLLLEHGYAALTLRGVATACNLRMGNLTYHFPSRESLVSALFDAIIRGYEDAFAEIMADQKLPPVARLMDVCRLIMDDIGTRRTTRLFPELWALSNRDPFVADRMYEMYDRARAAIVSAVRCAYPGAHERSVDLTSIFITSAMEGMSIFAGYGKPYQDDRAEIAEIALDAFLHASQAHADEWPAG